MTISPIKLSVGSHKEGQGELCAMEAAAFLAGEDHTDQPECVEPSIAAACRALNDYCGSDELRQDLWPLVLMSLGTAEKWEERRNQYRVEPLPVKDAIVVAKVFEYTQRVPQIAPYRLEHLVDGMLPVMARALGGTALGKHVDDILRQRTPSRTMGAVEVALHAAEEAESSPLDKAYPATVLVIYLKQLRRYTALKHEGWEPIDHAMISHQITDFVGPLIVFPLAVTYHRGMMDPVTHGHAPRGWAELKRLVQEAIELGPHTPLDSYDEASLRVAELRELVSA